MTETVLLLVGYLFLIGVCIDWGWLRDVVVAVWKGEG